MDLELFLGNDKYLVQCKQWKTSRVGVATVRELYGVMAAEGAVGGYVVASGDFTDEAHRFAEGRAIELVPTESLLRLVKETATDAMTAPTSASAVPSCPRCGSDMVERTARKGPQAGTTFWGCSRYPSCRGTRA